MQILSIHNWSELLIGSAVGIVVVFFALTILVLLFEAIQSYTIYSSKKKQVKAGIKPEEVIEEIAANEIAAISMALHLLMNELHDNESNIITIKRIERRYSPWNSKIYGLNNINR